MAHRSTDKRKKNASKPWRAVVKVRGEFHFLGYFHTEEEALWHEWKFKEQMGCLPNYVRVLAPGEVVAQMQDCRYDPRASSHTLVEESNLSADSA